MFVCAGGGASRDTFMVKEAEVTDSTQQTLISLFFPCLLDSDLIIIELMESQCKEELVLHIVVVGFHHKKGCQVRLSSCLF